MGYHQLHCNADHDLPVGCPGCSCEAGREIKVLRSLLKHADDVVIWEHTPARAGFQEEIEAALGIGK